MLADPQTLTIGTTPGAVSLPRIIAGENRSVYRSADSTVSYTLSTLYGARARRMARVDLSKISPDVFLPTSNVRVSASAFLVIDQPMTGFTVEELSDLTVALTSALTADSGATILKLLGGES